jgi:hypothetical protein
MTIPSLEWVLARPRRSAAVTRSRHRAIVTRWGLSIVTRHLGPARRPVPPDRRPYPDLFFADPVAVEDDSRRMRHGTRYAIPRLPWPASQWRVP